MKALVSTSELRNFIRDQREVIVLGSTAAASLIAIQYFVKADGMTALMRFCFPEGTFSADLLGLVGWSLGCVACYLILPLIVCRLSGWSMVELGFNVRGLKQHGPIYLVCFAPMAVIILLVSARPDFQATYPFLDAPPNLQEFLIWELCYAAQFIALEFFFRGFLVHGLRKHLSSVAAVMVMLFPYLMIHFGKPMLESIGALIAGIVLGTLSLRTGSIAGGALLHIAVAWSMDTTALWRAGWFQ
ncbi:MAG: CPBP family intramembrane glutamic endopeptidase [Limisphaerales bacterium]